MILYLDTSALVKLYVREAGSAGVRREVREAAALATSVVAYAETRAAFGRLRSSKLSSETRHKQRQRRFALDWEALVRVELSEEVLRSAGDLAELHGLRGFDAIHLASALWLRERAPQPLKFAAFDTKLASAAANSALSVFPFRLSSN